MAPEIARQIDSIVVTLNAGGMNTINIILAFVMYGVALGIQPRIFVDVFKKPNSVLLGMLCQLVLLPLLTFLLAWVLGPAVSFSMAMGMIFASPRHDERHHRRRAKCQNRRPGRSKLCAHPA